MQKVGIIGVGKIGGSLLVRLAESGDFDLSASDVHQEQLAVYEKAGVHTTPSNLEVAERSDLVFVAVKPWDVGAVMAEISPAMHPDGGKAVASVAAGVTIASISERLPAGASVLRVMPKVCASVGLGSSVVTANEPGRQ